jgi:hypothetical protein
MTIHAIEGGYVISSHRVWLPGVYEDERTARYAFRLPVAALQRLQDAANARTPDRTGGTITWGDVAKEAEAIREATQPPVAPQPES